MTDRRHAHGTIRWLSDELRDQVFYVSDRELRRDIIEWLRRASQLPEADVMSHVEDRLSEVRRDESDGGIGQHEMRRVSEDGTKDFPDSCADCDHYGVRCPVFVDPVERSRRERIQEEYADADDSAVRQAYRRYAEHNGCHQIVEALREWSQDYQKLAAEGYDLYERTDVDLGRTDESSEAKERAEEALAEVDV